MAHHPHVVRSLFFALLAALAATPAAAAPWMSTVVFGLPISFEDCRTRVASALASQGYGDTRDFGNGWLGFTATHSAPVGCIHGDGETVVSIVVASDGDNTAQRDRLAAAVRGDTQTESRHLQVSFAPGGGVVVSWRDTPGNAQDWVSIRPLGAPDDEYGATWSYTEGARAGSRGFGPLPPGEYEVRLYHDWPNGGFTVQERLRFRVGG